MRAALLSDLHTNLRSRQEECWRVLDWIVADLRERRPDLIKLGGDLFETPPTPAEEDRAAEWLLELADIAPVVGVMGNHDLGGPAVPRRRLAVDQLERARHPITIVDTPRVLRAAGAAIACFPWPRGAQLLATMGDAGRDERHAAGVAGMRAILMGLGAQLAEHDGPRILLMHCHVRGVRLGSHVPERVDFEVGVEDLALAAADFGGLGHIHEHQVFEFRREGVLAPMVYPGSPYANTFGETERKGYVIADFDDGRPAVGSPLRGWEFVPTVARPLAHLDYDWQGPAHGLDWQLVPYAEGPVQGAEVRLRYTVAADQRDAAARAMEAKRAQLLAGGAASVVLEPIIHPTVRARMPEIAAAESPADKVALWADGQGVEPERVERLRGMTANLEKEVTT